MWFCDSVACSGSGAKCALMLGDVGEVKFGGVGCGAIITRSQ